MALWTLHGKYFTVKRKCQVYDKVPAWRSNTVSFVCTLSHYNVPSSEYVKITTKSILVSNVCNFSQPPKKRPRFRGSGHLAQQVCHSSEWVQFSPTKIAPVPNVYNFPRQKIPQFRMCPTARPPDFRLSLKQSGKSLDGALILIKIEKTHTSNSLWPCIGRHSPSLLNILY